MKKKILSLLLALAMCLSLSVPAWAAGPTSLTYYYEITEEGTREVSNLSAAALTLSGKNIVAIPVSKSLVDGKVATTLNLSSVKSPNTTLLMADELLSLAGFSESEIDGMSAFEKEGIIGGQELTTIRAVAKPSDSVTTQKNSWFSTLSYTRHSMTRYYFTVTGEGMGPNFKWANLLCVQGFALDYNTASFHSYYWVTDSAGNRIRLVSDVLRYSSNNDPFEMPSGATLGSGIGISFDMNDVSFIERSSSFFRLATYADNSNVNLPGETAGSVGGSFVVYGNTSLIPGISLQVSFSYPWGISVSGIGSDPIPCKNTLTACLYR